MLAKVQDGGESLQSFPVANSVKQGCVMDPTLFSMMVSAMLMDPSMTVIYELSIGTIFVGSSLAYKWK